MWMHKNIYGIPRVCKYVDILFDMRCKFLLVYDK